MADFFIVPPRLTVGSFDRADAVTSLNSLKGDITITADPSTGLRVSISSGQFAFSITPDFYIKKSGDTVPGNIRFIPSGTNFGLAVAAGVANPGTGTTGAIFLNTADGKLKFHDGFYWQNITAVAGIALTTADLRYLKLDGTNSPSANISMGSQFLRFANLATQSLSGLAGQVFYNTDSNILNFYNGSTWTPVSSGITSITAGTGLTTATNPIVNSGTISVDQAYDFTWTGANTFNSAVSFAAAGQTFAASKLFIAGQSAGDLIYYSGSSWVRLGIGSTNQVLTVNTAGTSLTWSNSAGGGGAGTVFNGAQYSIPYYPSTGSAVTGSVNFQNTGTGISIAYTTGSSNTSSGALNVLGGVGIGGSLYVSSATAISGVTINAGVITGNLTGTATTATYSHQSGHATTSGLATTASNLNIVNASSGIFYPILSNTSLSVNGIGASVNSFFSFNASTGAFGATSVNILTGQSYSIGGNSVLSATSLGTGVTNSSLTALGTITTGNWAGSTITGFYGGTGYNSYNNGDILVGAGSTFIKVGLGSTNYVLSSSSIFPGGIGWTHVTAVGIGITPPSNENNADLWWNATDGSLNVYYSDGDTDQWVEIAGGSGIDLSQPVHITSTVASTSTSTGALIVDGGVGVGGQLNATSVRVNGGYDLLNSSLVTSTSAANQVGFAVSSAGYRTLKFIVSVDSSSDYQSDEILMMHSGSTVFMTEYAQLLSGSGTTITTYDGDISSGNLRLLVSPLNAVTNYSISCIGLRV